MKRIILILTLACLILTLMISISQAGEGQLVVQGSTTVLPIAQAAAEVFMQNNPQANISVRGGGSGNGIAALIEGTCDIADASRPMKVKEILLCQKKGISPVPHIVAMDGIAIIVHSSNPIQGLNIEEIKDIYTGKISNWKELGGEDRKIVVVSRDSSSGTFETFEKIVLKGKKVIPESLAQASNQTVATVISTTKGAIGYVGLGYISNTVKALPVNGVIPERKTVVSGKYPISRPLYMYTDGAPQGVAKDFLKFICSKEGQKIVEKQGFVPLSF
ncbi:phosphate ABC transporter substrate-binding protein [Candidatus Atribacteria bacterium 4572_76]|nr:MAG: phosphate ABC transporter substrate-binding protein [Candidatus Atribacteria bacterium 4572_76]HDK26082.1 phosphate ABC transporter substrate-binding protein [Candidatus Atribacteria bacterium]